MPTHDYIPGTGALTAEQGQTLVRLARLTIEARLKVAEAGRQLAALTDALQDPAFSEHRACFVTLKRKNGELRGCIGSLVATEALRDNIWHNAVNAAFQDPRFAPLSVDELPDIHIDVSVLTEPSPLAFRDAADLASLLRPHIDGVILRRGQAGATFLPQVWEQLPRVEDFLSHLCRKAGLAPSAWQDEEVRVETYQVQYFEEQP